MKIIERKDFVEIKHKNFKVLFCAIGASLFDVTYAGKHMVMRPINRRKLAYDIHSYHGKTAGRICGRVPNSKLVFKDKTYQMDLNDGINSLHGGKYGISTRRFSYNYDVLKDGVKLTFTYNSPDGEMGYPGNVKINVIYTVKTDKSILIEFVSLSDQDTPIDLTNHCYYNLGGETDVRNHFLKGNVEGCYFAREDTTCDVSKIVKFKDADFKKGCFFNQLVNEKIFKDFFQQGIDHCFVFSSGNNHLEVTSKKYKMIMTTDYPCFQIYSENFPKKNYLLNNLRFDKKYQAIAIEPQEIPVDFEKMISPKGKEKRRWMKMEFSKI